MKKLYSLFLLAFVSAASFAQTPFNPSEKFGFDAPSMPWFRNGSVYDLKTFKSKLYAAMGPDSGYVFSSSTGDPGSFQRVYGENNVKRVEKLETTNDGAGYLYMSTSAPTFSVHIVKSTTDGTTWNNYFNVPGMSAPYTINAFKPLSGTIDSVYITYYGANGTTVVKNSINANDPTNSLMSWDTIGQWTTDFGGFAYPTASHVHNGTLYYATSDNKLITSSDGQTMQVNTDFENSMGGASGTGNTKCTAMETFGGDLYLGTDNNAGIGFELWKTSDGITYDRVIDSLGGPINTVARLKSAGGKLWILAKDGATGFKVYSYDGTSVVLEESNEFGAADIDVQSASGMEFFNNHLYIGATHFKMPALRLAPGNDQVQATPSTKGGQIWRACLIGTFPPTDITTTLPVTVCAGTPVSVSATGAPSYVWSTGETTTSINAADSGELAVTGVGANGCRYADFGQINYHSTSMAPAFTVGNNPAYIGTSYAVCLGDSSPVIIARDPINGFHAFNTPSANSGFQTTANPDFAGNLDMTIEFWFMPTYGNLTLISEYDTLTSSSWANNNYSLIHQDYNNDVWINIPGNSSSEIFIGNVGSTYGVWNHVVLRYDATNTRLDGFLNGVVSGTDIRTREIPNGFGGYDAYKFGMDAATPGFLDGYNSYVRDVRVWNSVRSDSEILANMYALPSGTYPDLVYYYKMMDVIGPVVSDSSGNGYNGTVNGSGVFLTPQVVSWSADPTLISVGASGAIMHPSASTTYTAYYTDLNGCSTTGSFNVTPLYAHIEDLGGNNFASCGGDSVLLQVATNTALNTPDWTSTSIGSVQNYTVNVAPAAAEFVYFTDTIGGSCVLQDSVLIKVGPAFVSGVGNPAPIQDCEGTVVTLDADAIGGTAPYTYHWNQPGLAIFDSTIVDTFLYTIPNFYNEINLIAIDAIGCSYTLGFNSTPFNSTDLFGHVSTIAPVNVDNGFVYVFKHQPGSAGLDTVGYTSLDANGDYLFSPLYAGNYLIKVLPDETDFPLAVPTYYGNAFQWDSSLVYTHGCAQQDTANIVVVESTANLIGPGSISGYILEGDSFGVARLGPGIYPHVPFAPGGPLKGIDVKLGKNPGGGIQARVSSDSTGFYAFDSLPVGGYKIYVDIPNLPMDSTREIVITGADSSAQNNYFADSASIYINPDTVSSVGIYSSAKQYENKFSIYPNPAKGTMYVSYELSETSTVSFEITNMMGQLVNKEPVRKYAEGQHTFIFNTEQLNLQGGVYFMSIITNNKKYTQRIVVID